MTDRRSASRRAADAEEVRRAMDRGYVLLGSVELMAHLDWAAACRREGWPCVVVRVYRTRADVRLDASTMGEKLTPAAERALHDVRDAAIARYQLDDQGRLIHRRLTRQQAEALAAAYWAAATAPGATG